MTCETAGAMSGDFSTDCRGQGRYWGTTGYCGYTSRETTGILSGVKSNIYLSPIMLIIIK